MDNNQIENEEELEEPTTPGNCYLYIHILPQKTGDSSERLIVPGSTLSSFDFAAYKENNNIYKTKKFNFCFGPEGEKRKCFVLYAADNYLDVQKKSQKRIGNPIFSNTLDIPGKKSKNKKESTKQTMNDLDDIPAVKHKRKDLKKLKKSNKQAQEKLIIDTYVNDANESSQDQAKDFQGENYASNSQDNFYDIEEDNFVLQDAVASSTLKSVDLPVVENNDPKNTAAAIRAYKAQIQFLKNKLGKLETEKQNEKGKSVILQSTENEENFAEYDSIYSYDPNENKSIDRDVENVDIGQGIMCKVTSYVDAFKTKNPHNCLLLLSLGVYGARDLSKRCVKKQKNTRHLQQLCPKKTLALERQLYRFLRIKRYKLIEVEHILSKVNSLHHQVIHAARQRVENEPIPEPED